MSWMKAEGKIHLFRTYVRLPSGFIPKGSKEGNRLKHIHLAVAAAALFVVACIAPSFADSSVNVLARR